MAETVGGKSLPTPVTEPVQVSVIIVNWRSKDYVASCISSILNSPSSVRVEIVVVDSGSFDGCDEVVERFGGPLRFIQCDTNVGFGQANNRAVAQSSGELLLFLNPDTEVTSGAIDVLYEAATSLSRVGIVGGRLLNSDGTTQTTSIKSFPTLATEIVDVDALRRIFPRARLWGMRPLFEDSATPSEVDVVS